MSVLNSRPLPLAARRGQSLPTRGLVTTRSTTAPRTSLIPETLRELDADPELIALHERVKAEGQAALTREERRARQRSLAGLGLPSFEETSRAAGVPEWRRDPTKILQVNIGLYCNQACSHCHVESSPRRTEHMDRATVDHVLRLLDADKGVGTLDITGGAPEMSPQFRYLVAEARRRGLEVIDRCNLTVLLEPGQEDLGSFLTENKVRVVASLPCYSESNVDKQRGRGVFDRSIEALLQLNELGYGREGTGLTLDLVYNPGGAFLAPAQAKLEVAYRSELGSAYGIVFNRLFCLNNMPIKRFADSLLRSGKMDEYMALLVGSFNPAAAKGVMCRDLISVRWDGAVYDCDFNQQLDLPVLGEGGKPVTVAELGSLGQLRGGRIRLDSHCYGCTAGAGSSCQGETA